MDPDLPFYLWTSREPYRQHMDPFDNDGNDRPGDNDRDNHGYGRAQRLHRLRRCAREDPAIFVAGRALIPARHGVALRQRLFRPPAQLPDIR